MGFIKYLKWSGIVFLQSWKLDRLFLYAMLIDLCYYSLLIVSFIFIFPFTIMKAVYGFMGTNSLLTQAEPEMLESLGRETVGYGWAIVGYALLFIALFLILRALVKGSIWQMMLDKKVSMGRFLRTMLWRITLANVIFSAAFLLLFILLYALTKQEAFPVIVVFVLVPLFFFLISVAYPLIIQRRSLWRGLGRSVKLLGKLHHFIIPLLLLLVVGTVLLLLITLLRFLPQRLLLFIGIMVAIAYLTWAKSYTVRIIRPLIQ
jgi:hypothetical protein